MRYFSLKLIVAGSVFCLAVSVEAESLSRLEAQYQKVAEEGKLSHLLEIDNDTLLLNKSDGFYTSGVRYSQRKTLREDDRLTVFGWRVGQDLYTPSDIKLPPAQIGPPDHPYAGWLYGGFFREQHDADGSYSKLGIDIGCIGPCAGGDWTQTNFHRLVDQPLPQGWSKQVKNEPGIVLHAKIAPIRWTLMPSIDITPHMQVRVGNIFSDAGLGVMLRAGELNTFPNQPTLHGFLRLEGYVVGHNATLQGGYFSDRNPHTVEPKRFAGMAEVGMAWSYGEYGFQASLVRLGNEIRNLPDSTGAQNILRLQFLYAPQ